jgi:hypothetical protein
MRTIISLVLLFLIIALAFSIGTTRYMPPNAQVYGIAGSKEYYAPKLCEDLLEKDEVRLAATRQDISTAYKLRKDGYVPNKRCEDRGAFREDGRSIAGLILQMAHVLKPLPSRWNEDGSWNW